MVQSSTSMVHSDDTALVQLFRAISSEDHPSVRMLYTVVSSGALVWLFSPAWDAVERTLEVGFICPFGVIGPAD